MQCLEMGNQLTRCTGPKLNHCPNVKVSPGPNMKFPVIETYIPTHSLESGRWSIRNSSYPDRQER